MSISEGALLLCLLVLVLGGGYGLYLKRQAELDSREADTDLKAPPAE